MNNNLLDCTESIYSKVDKGKLLHQLFRPNYKKCPHRINISPENESIQVSHLSLKKNQTFKAHKHILFDRNMPMAQESWIVISGKVRVYYYDLDESLITTKDIQFGDCTITYRGGHNYESLEENTIIYECKTGPYFGVEKDKVFLRNSS